MRLQRRIQSIINEPGTPTEALILLDNILYRLFHHKMEQFIYRQWRRVGRVPTMVSSQGSLFRRSVDGR